MKATFLALIATLLLAQWPADTLSAQPNLQTSIQYEVPYGVVYPVWASSNMIQGQLAVNDTTGVIEKLDFDVPLNSFIGQNAGYLEWLGYSITFPDLKFHSNRIKDLGDGKYEAAGSLEFRGHFTPLTMKYKR